MLDNNRTTPTLDHDIDEIAKRMAEDEWLKVTECYRSEDNPNAPLPFGRNVYYKMKREGRIPEPLVLGASRYHTRSQIVAIKKAIVKESLLALNGD
jgi:hypothetical protein